MSDATNTYLKAFEAFEASLNSQPSSPLHQARRSAIETFSKNGFPTPKDEAWKSINLAALTDTFTATDRPDSSPPTGLVESHAQGIDGWTLVFVDGYFDERLSNFADLPEGLTLTSIADALTSDSAFIEAHMGKVADNGEHAFTALNTAFLKDGAIVHVKRGVVVDKPIHVLYLSTATQERTVSYQRSLFVTEENSQVTIVETFAGVGTESYLSNHVAEIVIGDNSVVDHYKVGLEADQALHVSNQKVRQGRTSNFSSHSISVGGAFVRNDVSSALDGEACESTINGLYVLNGTQHCDNYTLLEHCQPNCPSHELYKGILDDSSRAVFRGKIHVHQIAQGTDAYQQNKNILLSESARVNTKPQLEIYADDVKCSHGATIGQLDEDALFYLQARGIDKTAAHRMMLEAFAGDILSRIKIDGLREALTSRVLDKIQKNGTTR
ncbi:MAG TPA: Fe-S cluster assembly protein SufD [Candidatus Latescibacteria bacterium]|nr:Fe-S cluster assembly protein SufD [Candidatus Latescibacterota bacterium]